MEPEPSELVGSLLADETPTPDAEPAKVTPDPAPDDQPAVVEAQPEPESIEPLSVKQYAESKGIDPKDLYSLKLPSGATISDLNDKAKDYDTLDVQTVSHAREVAEFKAERLKFEEEASDWVALIQQGDGSQEAFQKLQAQKAERAKHFEQQTLAAIPEWADPTAKEADQLRINEFTGRFGAPPGVSEALTAPWANLMMRYVLTLEDKYHSALQTVQKVKNKPTPTPRKPSASNSPPQGLNKAAAALFEGM